MTSNSRPKDQTRQNSPKRLAGRAAMLSDSVYDAHTSGTPIPRKNSVSGVENPMGKSSLTLGTSMLCWFCMSARKLGNTSLGVSPGPSQCLTVPANSVRIRKNGIEFRNADPLTPWTEMTVTLQRPGAAIKVNFTGVVVACAGNRQQGYQISMLFTHVSRLSQARLLAYS